MTVEKDIDLPDWFQDLVDAITGVTKDAITDPIIDLYTGIQIEGWSIPPFQCMICGKKFTATDPEDDDDVEERYGLHLMAHINAYTDSWFPGSA